MLAMLSIFNGMQRGMEGGREAEGKGSGPEEQMLLFFSLVSFTVVTIQTIQ